MSNEYLVVTTDPTDSYFVVIDGSGPATYITISEDVVTVVEVPVPGSGGGGGGGGGGMTSADFVFNEVPIGAVNNINASFMSTFNFVPGTVELFLNGLKQKLIDDFSTSGTRNISLNVSPLIGENLLLNYIKGP